MAIPVVSNLPEPSPEVVLQVMRGVPSGVVSGRDLFGALYPVGLMPPTGGAYRLAWTRLVWQMVVDGRLVAIRGGGFRAGTGTRPGWASGYR